MVQGSYRGVWLSTAEDKSLLVEVARLYYEDELNQQEIASKVGTSRPSISRLLQQARNEGIVRIEINDPSQRHHLLEQSVKEKYRLKQVRIVPSEMNSEQKIKMRLGQAAARYLDEVVFDGCILGVSWGTTMRQIVEYLIPKPVHQMTVVQIVGGITNAQFDPHASEIAQRIGDNYHASSYLLLLPAIVDSAELKSAMISDKQINKTLDLIRNADIVLCSMGVFKPDSLLIQAEYFNTRDVQVLKRYNAVGDICSRMIDAQGHICWPELDARTVAVELDQLKKTKYAIAVAGGETKKEVIRAGLRGGYFNVLITDEDTAEFLCHST
jgi:deoxyribonucleoside regulator